MVTGLRSGRNEIAQSGAEGLVDVCGLDDKHSIRPDSPEVDSGNARSLVRVQREGNSKRSRPSEVCTSAHILKFFWTYFPTPIANAPRLSYWIDNEQLCMSNTSKIPFKDAADQFERDIFKRSVEEIYRYLKSGDPQFGCVDGHLLDRYETRADSLKYLRQFLELQLKTEVEIRHFTKFLYLLLNKKSGKRNCLNIYGPPSSGKTYFTRMVKEAMITSGQILNMSRNSQFPFNNCVCKRVLLWDEPAYEQNALETLKTLFSGDETVANKKYSDFEIIPRTPVIVTANRNEFPRTPAFQCRIKNYTFESAEFLKDLKYLHPMALYDFFIEMKLMDD